ncbi:hypothetical protein [Bradyrhizobium genosp. P]
MPATAISFMHGFANGSIVDDEQDELSSFGRATAAVVYSWNEIAR